MLRTTTHRVTSAHCASFLPDVGKGDVCIVFDFRRYPRDVFELTMQAQGRAKILVITDPWFSAKCVAGVGKLAQHTVRNPLSQWIVRG